MNVIRTQPGSQIKEKLMRSRTKILVSALVAGASFAAAIPASAQNYPQSRYEDRYDRDGRYDDRDGRYEDRDGRHDSRHDRNHQYRGNANAIAQQIRQLQYRVERTDMRDRISEREAAGLRRAVYNLRLQFRDFNRNGLSQRESQILQQRVNQIRERLRYERRDNDGRRW